MPDEPGHPRMYRSRSQGGDWETVYLPPTKEMEFDGDRD
jgi:hypothetical protein